MGFFEEFGNLIKKYNLEIHTIQIDENIRILNEKFHLNLKKEDLPPPAILFRTTEGDFIPTVFGPIATKNGEENVKFMNVANNEIINLYPQAEAETETKTESVAVQKDPHDIENKYYIVGPMMDIEKCNQVVFNTFIDTNAAKLRYYNTSNNFIQTFISPEAYAAGTLDLASKEGKEVMKKLKKSIIEYDVIITLDGWKKSKEAKKLVDYATKQGKVILDSKDF